MVAASKMKKAQEAAVSSKPYAEKINQVTKLLASKIKVDWQSFPLLKENRNNKILVILTSTNKGLCGGLNTNLFRAIENWFGNTDNIDYIALGKKGEAFIVRTKKKLISSFNDNFLDNIGAITNLIVDLYNKGEYSQVFFIYNNFVSILKQQPVKETILPIKLSDQNTEPNNMAEFVVEPSDSFILKTLLPHYLEVQIRRAILEALACEHSARMLAMKAATDNATELMKELTLVYNRIRQQLITSEIADIVTAREAVAE